MKRVLLIEDILVTWQLHHIQEGLMKHFMDGQAFGIKPLVRQSSSLKF